jgi:hypothetical protein
MRGSSLSLPYAGLAALFVVGGMACPARAEETPHRFALDWARVPNAVSCISGPELAVRVEERLGRAVFEDPAHADVAIEGHVEPTENGWHAVISINDVKGAVVGTRELSSAAASCRDLDAPLVLTIALLVDPNAALAPPPTPPAEVAPPAPPVATPAPPRQIRPIVRSPEATPWRGFTMIGGGVGAGLLPEVAPTLTIRLGIVAPHVWPIVLDGALFGEEHAAAPQNGAPITFSLAWGGVSTCPISLDFGLGGFSACAGVDAGAVSTRGLSDSTLLSRQRFTASAVVRVATTLNIGHHFFFAGVPALVLPFVRDSFDYVENRDREQVFQMSPVAVTVDVGLGFRTP